MWENSGGSIDLGHMTRYCKENGFFFVLSSDIHWVITKCIFLIGITVKDKIWDGQFRLYELVKETTGSLILYGYINMLLEFFFFFLLLSIKGDKVFLRYC